MTWLEKIDVVFKTLYEKSGNNPTFRLLEEWLYQKCGDSIDKGEIQDILLYLYRKGYIYCEYRGNRDHSYIDDIDAHYLISSEGKMHLEETGGYVKHKQAEDLKKQEIIDDLALRKRNDRRLVIGTYLVAAGAIGLIIWEMIKTFLIEEHSLCH